MIQFLKALFHGCLVHFVNITNYAFSCALELNVKEEITWKRQNNSFVSNKYILPQHVSNVTNNKNELWKTARLRTFQKPTISIHFNLLQVCPSVPRFLFAVLLISSFNILSDYFYVSPNSVAVPSVRYSSFNCFILTMSLPLRVDMLFLTCSPNSFSKSGERSCEHISPHSLATYTGENKGVRLLNQNISHTNSWH